MARFRFRLQSVLRYREQLRKERQWELHSLEKARDNLTSEIRKLEQMLDLQGEDVGEPEGEFLSAANIMAQGEFSLWLVRSINQKRELLAATMTKLEEKRDDVVRANREVKTLEQLRRLKWEEHRLEEYRAEEKFLDEVGQRRTAQEDDRDGK